MTSYFTYDSNLRDRNKYTSTVQTTFGTKRYFSSLDTEVYIARIYLTNESKLYKDSVKGLKYYPFLTSVYIYFFLNNPYSTNT